MLLRDKDSFKTLFQFYVRSLYGKTVQEAGIEECYFALGSLLRGEASFLQEKTKKQIAQKQKKRMYYFSLEFLLGKMLENNLRNLDLYEEVERGLQEYGIALTELIKLEKDPGLGNGGLGRLAACFMDSLASLNYPGTGNPIRYKYGLFKQLIENNEQIEVPDCWLAYGNPWEVRRSDKTVDIKFEGHIVVGVDDHGELTFTHQDAQVVRAVAYEMPVIGAKKGCTNILRMWSAEPIEALPPSGNVRKYLADIEDLCLNVYPDDSGEEGKKLRIKQEYFFVAAGLAQIVREHLEVYPDLHNFHEKNVIQLNDTHPALAIPELMRILMDEYRFSWQEAWNITFHTFAYTNHTVMFEALEKWPLDYVNRLLPRIYMIIEEIDRQYHEELVSRGYSEDFYNYTRILGRYHVRMANLSVIGSFSVNGVALLHSDILKKDVFKDYYQLYPERFHNVTNGVSPRRFFLYSNPALCKLVETKIAECLGNDFCHIEELHRYASDPQTQASFLNVKKARKDLFAQFLKETYAIEVDSGTVFDVMAKRLHAYKRQLLDIFYIIYLYQRFQEEPDFTIPPTTFFFAAKAAASYRFAKEVIKLINCVSECIARDPRASAYLRVVFIPNYRVTVSEIMIGATDISEQISLAGKEASGTGNMKMMMNGAVTLGTLDGANVEIAERVGKENIIIFGHTAEEIRQMRANYRALEYYHQDIRIRKIIDALTNGSFAADPNAFKEIANEFLLRNDEYFLLADFASYIEAHEKAYEWYQDSQRWARVCLHNIASSGYFSSDRSVSDYAKNIWQLEPLSHE